MITRYALGPRITVIGRERVKRAEKQCRCQVRVFTWRKNKRTPGKRPRLSRLCAKAAERQTGLSGSAAPSPPGPRRPSDRKPEPSSLPSVPPAAGPLGRHELRGGPAKVKLLPRVRQQGARPGGRGPGGRQRAVACPVPAPESEGRCASRTRPPPGCPRRPGRTPGREVLGHERRLARGHAWPVRGGRACRAAVRGPASRHGHGRVLARPRAQRPPEARGRPRENALPALRRE